MAPGLPPSKLYFIRDMIQSWPLPISEMAEQAFSNGPFPNKTTAIGSPVQTCVQARFIFIVLLHFEKFPLMIGKEVR